MTGYNFFTNEYRQANENSNFLADFGFVNGYKNNNRSFICKLWFDLKLDKFEGSNLFVSFEQVSNDTYLNIFEDHLTKSAALPANLNSLNNKIKLTLEHKIIIFHLVFTWKSKNFKRQWPISIYFAIL